MMKCRSHDEKSQLGCSPNRWEHCMTRAIVTVCTHLYDTFLERFVLLASILAAAPVLTPIFFCQSSEIHDDVLARSVLIWQLCLAGL